MIKQDQHAHSHPMVAIVGRPNVGKSALFNRLAGRDIAIVHDRPGVTRDRLTAICQRGERPFEIMDTGGIGETIADEFAAQVQAEARLGIEVADVILFVVDGKTGMVPVDQTLAEILRRTTKPIVITVNKIDDERKRINAEDFASLGFKHSSIVSAAHGLGITDLVRKLDDLLESHHKNTNPVADKDAPDSTPPLKLAIVGRPNAGKSSLINAVLGEQRTIVSEVAGTTRDSIDIPCILKGKRYLLIDTAGMRRKAKIHDQVETFSSLRAANTIRRADICLLVVDCAEGAKMQDRKIASLIVEYRKPCIIVLNKYDLYHPDAPQNDRIEELTEAMGREFFFMRYAPMIAISAKKEQYLQKLFTSVEGVVEGAKNPPGTGILNRILHRAMENATPALGHTGKSFHLLYATVAKDETPTAIPCPTFILFANRKERLQESYLRHIEDIIRQEWPAPGVPFQFSVRGKEPLEKAKRQTAERLNAAAKPSEPRKPAKTVRKPDKPRRGAGRVTGGKRQYRDKGKPRRK